MSHACQRFCNCYETVLTSNSGPRLSVFNTFDFEMCFAPQWCALFPHRNFQSEMCFAPQRRAFFSTSQLPKVLRTRQMFTLLTSKCLRATTACTFQHHNFQKCSEYGVLLPFWLRTTTTCTFSISQLPKVIRTRQFFTSSPQMAPHPPL